jgi:hypothetical protein
MEDKASSPSHTLTVALLMWHQQSVAPAFSGTNDDSIIYKLGHVSYGLVWVTCTSIVYEAHVHPHLLRLPSSLPEHHANEEDANVDWGHDHGR